jgi:Fur family transcriptional regulator, zinc uptake regulator
MRRREAGRNAAYILNALRTSQRPLSAYELIEAIRPQTVAAPTTIYRALKKLISDGKAHRIESLNAFVACRHPRCAEVGQEHKGGVGFAICDRCGAINEFVDPMISETVAADLSTLAFLPRALTIEVRGLCASCREDNASAET